MKKLLFATAIAASAAAFAVDPINAVGFESYSLGSLGANGTSENNEFGTGPFFYFDGDSNSSVVTNESPSAAKRTAYFELNYPAATNNYLALDTEAGTLWRSIDTINSETVGEETTFSLGDARPVAATGTYLDTLVQFTVTEDEEPTVGSDDKLAIWLQAGEGTTNLMVKASYVYDNGSVLCTPTNFVVDAGKDIVPGEWYRLTVKAVADVTKSATDDPANAIVGFLIYIDNNPVEAETATFAESYISTATDADWGWIEDGDTTTVPLLQSKTVFPSLKGKSNTATLQGVGFQGTGAVDEIVWTEEDLFPAGGATTIEFTLTGAENATVSYVIGSEASQDWDGSSTISVEPSTTVTFTAAPANGYTYEGVTAEGWTVSGTSLVYTTNATEDVELAVPNAVALVTLTDPGIANATLTSPVLPAQYAPGATVELTWTAAPGYTFPNGQTTLTRTITVGTDDLAAIAAEVESSLSKQTFTVTLTDIENVTVAATTNGVDLTDLDDSSLTNKYTVEYNDTVTVTATPGTGFEYASAPDGWALSEGAISIETNVTEAVELAVPAPTAIPPTTYTLTIPSVTNESGTVIATAVVTNNTTSAQETIVNGEVTLEENTSVTVYWTAVDGYEIADGEETEDITMDADKEATSPTVTAVQSGSSLEPGDVDAATYNNAQAATNAAASVTIAVPAAVKTAGVDETTYKNMFEAQVVDNGDGTYEVTVGFKAAVVEDLQTQVNTDAGTLVGTLTTAGSEAQVATTPGLYYAIKYGSALNEMDYNTVGTLAEGATTSLPVPAKGQSAAFYKVIVSPKPITAVTPAP